MSRVIILGAGYVGLTLGVASARVGHEVFFVDIDLAVVSKLNLRLATFYEVGLQESLDSLFVDRGEIAFSSLQELYKVTPRTESVYVISLGTPLGPDGKALLAPVESLVREVSNYMSDGDLIILRSTVAVGTSSHLVKTIPAITNLSFCPERTIEGKALEELSILPQVISGNALRATKMAEEYFGTITESVICAGSLETAELIKLASNSFRDLNFAFANSLALISNQFGVNVNELISLANFRYDRNSIAFPGLAGGPCLEKDSYILAQGAPHLCSEILIGARHLNEELPNRALDFIQEHGVSSGSRVLVCGAAFKGRPLTSDTRGSFVYNVIRGLLGLGIEQCNIVIFDPIVSLPIFGVAVINDFDRIEGFFDYLIQLTNHEIFDSSVFDEFLSKRVGHVISFWPKNVASIRDNSINLFLGGLRAK